MSFPIYKNQEIRRSKINGVWYYAIKDVITALTDTPDPKGYIKDLRNRKPFLKKNWDTLIERVLLPTKQANQYINSAKADDIFEIISFVPNKKNNLNKFFDWLDYIDKD